MLEGGARAEKDERRYAVGTVKPKVEFRPILGGMIASRGFPRLADRRELSLLEPDSPAHCGQSQLALEVCFIPSLRP